jgi:hypothetical protein
VLVADAIVLTVATVLVAGAIVLTVATVLVAGAIVLDPNIPLNWGFHKTERLETSPPWWAALCPPAA